MADLGRLSNIAELLAAIWALPPERTRFVGIDGYGAAGKTTLAATLAAQVEGSVVVHLDDFQGAGVVEVQEWDWTAMNRDVAEPLLAGRPGRYAVLPWGETEPTGYEDVPCGSVVIVEGVSSTRREVRIPWDVTVWVETPEPLRRSRALERDGVELQELWLERWTPSEEAYVAREQPAERVDFVVPGTS